jgi:hypothetical protein
MPSGVMSLGDTAQRAAALEFACNRSPRAGRYRVSTLLERFAAAFTARQWLTCFERGLGPYRANSHGTTSTIGILL